MKKTILLLALIASTLIFAQVPQGISYQAIALNGSGNPIVSSNVGLRLSLLDNSATGTVIYTETHTKTTTAQGLYNLIIGQGAITFGTFSTINWGTNTKFLKVEIDVAGGTNYVLVGSTQLLSVPYALYAERVKSIAGNALINDEIIENQSSSFLALDSSDKKLYAYSTSGNWSVQSYLGFNTPVATGSSGNFAVLDSSDKKIYAYSGKSGTWAIQAYLGFNTPVLTASNGYFAVLDSSDKKIYAYSGKTAIWTIQPYLGFNTPVLTASNGNFAVLDSSDKKIYAYLGKTGTWTTQSYLGFNMPVLTASNGNFAVLDSSDKKIYSYSGSTGTWSVQPYLGFNTPTLIESKTN